MKQTGLRFLFEHGAFFQVVMSEDEAKNLLHLWHMGNCRGKITGPGWVANLDSVVAIHTVPLEQAPVQIMPGPISPWLKGSGLN